MENEDVVPMLVTLENHLSEEFDSKLKGSLNTVDNDMSEVETDSKKVPITILTGVCQRKRELIVRISWLGQDDIIELCPERGTRKENCRHIKWYPFRWSQG